MRQITSMHITGISFLNFRNHTQKSTYPLFDLTYIAGRNRAGKTTMAHGIVYALFGVSYYGEQNIERLMNENSQDVRVQLDFTDQNGEPHQLVRARRGKSTTITLDTFTVRQSDIDSYFCTKEVFLMMFNPFYLVERAGEEGRRLLLKHLQSIPMETVLNNMSEGFRAHLDDLTIGNPSEMLNEYREKILKTNDQLISLEGSKIAINEAHQSYEENAAELEKDLDDARMAFTALKEKQFNGIDPDNLVIRRDMLARRLSGGDLDSSSEIYHLESEINMVKQRTYQSKYQNHLADINAQFHMVKEKYQSLCNKAKNPETSGLKIGAHCPTCFREITAESLNAIKQELHKAINTIKEQGNKLAEQGKELHSLALKEKEVFEQFKADDVRKLEIQLEEQRAKITQPSNREQIQNAISEIEDTLRYGNLSETEYLEMTALEADIVGIQAKLNAQKTLIDDSKLQELLKQQEKLNDQINRYQNIISSLIEFIAVQTRLIATSLQMPNVKLKLYEIVKSTGEVRDIFRFTYKNRDFSCLSLSEKTLAGIEVAAMIRKVTQIDCPICIDNTESIDNFNNVPMPSQVLLLRCVKNMELTVKGCSAEDKQTELSKAS